MGGAAPAVDAGRVIADLRELQRRTGGDAGAQRLCWTETWREGRAFLEELLAEIGAAAERDEAGNLWAHLGGAEGALALGSHTDSVPNGGWLDGALGVMAAVGVLRAWAAEGGPPRPLALVDWADEEGARFGRSLFGSSAFSGSLDVAELDGARDADGRAAAEVLAENGVSLERAPECGVRRERLDAYLELHIEQGPVLEAEGVRAAAVSGCVGIERHRLTFTGQASHAGTTPMAERRDAGLAAATAALRIEELAASSGGMATTGALRLAPGVPTVVPGEAELTVDLRHAEAPALAQMLHAALELAQAAAAERGCELHREPVWHIAPAAFDAGLVEAAREACREAAGTDRVITSGALHDAAEAARVLPAAMVFCPSRAGISHAPEEDTSDEDLARAIQAFGALAARSLRS
jgi:N-carbamoyl-L-amino-acid hydrolase